MQAYLEARALFLQEPFTLACVAGFPGPETLTRKPGTPISINMESQKRKPSLRTKPHMNESDPYIIPRAHA